MPLFRSIFWLGLAFVVIGPQINYQNSLGSLSQQAVQSGQQMLIEQSDVSSCGTLECVGTKLALSAGIDAVNSLVISNPLSVPTSNNPSYGNLVVPQPHDRLDRS